MCSRPFSHPVGDEYGAGAVLGRAGDLAADSRARLAASAHNTDRFLATYLHAPTLVFVIDGRVVRGFDSLREQQLKWWNQRKSDVIYTEQAPPQFVGIGRNAILVTERLASRRTGPDGKPTEGTFAVTSVWQHFRDGWRVSYAHESLTR